MENAISRVCTCGERSAAALPEFRVETRIPGGSWSEKPVELLLVGAATGHEPFPPEMLAVFGGIPEGTKMARAALCEFFSDGPLEVRVTAPGFGGDLHLSARKDVPVRRSGPGRLEFSLSGPEMALVRKGDDFLRGLSLWARPCPAAPDETRFRHVLRFGPGFHEAGSHPAISRDAHGAPVVRVEEDDTLVVLEKGARVEAAFDVRGARHVEICGGGRIDLARRLPHADGGFSAPVLWGPFRDGALPAVYVHGGASDVVVRDIAMTCDFRGVCTRFASGVALENLGIFTATTNADGVNLIASEDVRARSLYVRSQDDCFCAYNNCDSIEWLWDAGAAPRPMRRAALSESFLAGNARALVFGGHGFSGVRGGPNVLEDVEVSDCRILGNVKPCDQPLPPEEHRRYWSGIFRILSQSDELVRGLRFRDIVVEWVPGYAGSAFHLCVRTKDQVSYKEKSGGWRIEDVSFENVEFRNVPPPGVRVEDVIAAPPDDGTGIGIRRVTGVPGFVEPPPARC